MGEKRKKKEGSVGKKNSAHDMRKQHGFARMAKGTAFYYFILFIIISGVFFISDVAADRNFL